MTDQFKSLQYTREDAETLDRALGTLPKAGPGLLVALDLDGTTVRHDTSLSPRVAETIRAHVEAGTHIILATGRGVEGMLVVSDQLGLPDGYAVCSNGAIAVSRQNRVPDSNRNGVEVLHAFTFDPSAEIEVLTAGMPEATLAVEPVSGPRRISAEFPPGELVGDSVIVPISSLGGPDATRLTVRAPSLTASEMSEKVEAIGLHGVEYAIGWEAWLDISPSGVTKATSLELLRQSLGLDRPACLAVGDGANDIDMLAWAGVGVSMANARSEVHAAADAKVASVNDDGLAVALEALL